MYIFDVQIPFVGDVYCEVGGVTKARGGRFFDAALNKGGVEVWAGKTHVIVDRSPKRVPTPVVVAALALLAIVPVLGSTGNSPAHILREQIEVITGIDLDRDGHLGLEEWNIAGPREASSLLNYPPEG